METRERKVSILDKVIQKAVWSKAWTSETDDSEEEGDSGGDMYFEEENIGSNLIQEQPLGDRIGGPGELVAGTCCKWGEHYMETDEDGNIYLTRQCECSPCPESNAFNYCSEFLD